MAYKLAEATKGYSVEAVKMALVESNLNEEQVKAILIKKGLTDEELKETTAEILNAQAKKVNAEATEELTEKELGLKYAVSGLGDTLKKAGKSLIGFLKTPVGWATLAVGAIASVIGIFKKFVLVSEESQENLENSVSEFESVTDEIKSLEEELKTCTDRIAELQKLVDDGTISVADEKELELLKEENKELERKIALKQTEQIQSAKDVLNDAQKLSKKKVFSEYSDDGFLVDPVEELQSAMEKYNIYDSVKYNNPEDQELQQKLLDDASARAYEMYDIIEGEIDAYETLIDAGQTLEGEDASRYELLKKIQDEYLLHNYAVNGTLEAYKALNAEQQKSILYSKLIAQGLSDAQANAVLNNVSEEDYDDLWDKDFSFTPPEMTDYDTAEEYGKAYAEAWLEGIQDATSDENANETGILSFTEQISQVQKLSEGLDQLDEIYADVLDKEDFDYSSILNNDDFANAFSGYEDEYNNFIETITNSPNDINACQSAFNELATAYIYGTGALDNLTEESKEATIALLEQMGVANADEVVEYELAKAKAQEAIQSKENIEVTENNIDALINEANASGITTNAYLELVAEEILFNNNDINTESKCNQILNIASAAGVATASMETLNSELENVLGAKLGSGERTKYAEALGITVVSEKKRTDSNAEGNGNLYVFNGQEFEDLTDAVYYKNSYDAIQSIKSSYTPITLDYTGGTKTSSAKDKSTANEKDFDWIETKISRIERTISNLDKTVSATYKSWTERNKALQSEISAVTSEISTQQQAYNAYMSLAESVGLSDYYKKLVQNGAIAYSTITDEDLADKIQNYQEFYEKALDAQDAIIDLKDELATLEQTDFDNIITQYDQQLAVIEHETSMLESSADLLEAQGHMASVKIYDALIQSETKNLSMLQSELEALNKELNGNGIAKGTEQWYNMEQEIFGVEEAIKEAQKALVEYENALQELDWEIFEKLIGKIQGVPDESDFLIDLMSNRKMTTDEGGLSEYGTATLGLHAVNYNEYMQMADEYVGKIKELNQELADDPYNQTLLDKKNEYIEAQREAILNAENEKQAIIDLRTEGYEALSSSLDDAISKYKEMLDEVSDLYDYQKKIEDLTDNVSKYQKILNSVSGMGDTEEGKMLIQKYQVELSNAQDELEEAERQKTLEDIEKMLDSLSSETEEWINTRIDDIDGLLQDSIQMTNDKADEIKSTLESATSEVGTSLSNEMNAIWSTNGTFTSVVSAYNDGFINQFTTVNNTLTTIKDYIAKMVGDADAKASEQVSSTTSGTSSSTSSSSSTSNTTSTSSSTNSSGGNSSNNWKSALVYSKYLGNKSKLNTSTSIVDLLKSHDYSAAWNDRANLYKAMNGSGTYTGSSKQNLFMLKTMKSAGYKKGSPYIPYDQFNWIHEGEILQRASDGGMYTALGRGDKVFTKEMADNLWDFASGNFMPQYTVPSMPPMTTQTNNTSSIGDVSISFELPNVTNYNEFMQKMQRDPQFEGMIHYIAFGKNSTDKYKFKW